VLVMLGPIAAAHAHGVIGKRFFPATLAIDDPFVADELSLPTVSYVKSRDGSETDLSADLSKRLTPDLGLSLGGNLKLLDPDPGDSVAGFDNLAVALKYVFWKSVEHETLLSTGLDWDVGDTGSKKVGAESFHTLTPALFFGKGLGDLPDSLAFLRPVALTGSFGVSFPTRATTRITTVSAMGDVEVDREVNPRVVKWGFAAEYSMQYLESFVRDVGLGTPFNRMIPLVEVALTSPLDGPDSGTTTGTINPGLIWFGRYVQLGLEAQIPVNDRTGPHVGVLAQVHFYLDDIAPEIFTWTPFHGVLGPTQPK
jgi:hypothetical protein